MTTIQNAVQTVPPTTQDVQQQPVPITQSPVIGMQQTNSLFQKPVTLGDLKNLSIDIRCLVCSDPTVSLTLFISSNRLFMYIFQNQRLVSRIYVPYELTIMIEKVLTKLLQSEKDGKTTISIKKFTNNPNLPDILSDLAFIKENSIYKFNIIDHVANTNFVFDFNVNIVDIKEKNLTLEERSKIGVEVFIKLIKDARLVMVNNSRLSIIRPYMSQQTIQQPIMQQQPSIPTSSIPNPNQQVQQPIEQDFLE